MKPTFKEFLLEWDRGDFQLQQQAQKQQAMKQQAAAADAEARGGFAKQMAAKSPQKGDFIQTPAGRFLVRGGSMEGTMVKQIGGVGKELTVPHQTKFKLAGQEKSGANVWEVVR